MTAYGLYLVQYGIYFILLFAGIYQAYAALYTRDERIFLRNRVVRTLREKKGETEKQASESEVTRLFKEAGLSWFTNVRYALVRLLIMIVLAVYSTQVMSASHTALVIAIYALMTEPLIKYSLIRFLLSYRIKQLQHEREGELFTLFALLKTDLLASTNNQVNVYYLLNNTLPYFKQITPVLRRFMTLWRKSPQIAGSVFEEELGGETAKFIGDFLSRLHQLDRDEAYHLLDEQSELFAFERSELIMQKAEVQRNIYYTLFLIASFVGVAWLMWFLFTMTTGAMNFL